MRFSGIYMSIWSLDSRYKIGSMGESAYRFIDFLKLSGQKYWEIPPIYALDDNFAPLTPMSAFAGNPMIIDIDLLIEENLLTDKDVRFFKNKTSSPIDFEECSYAMTEILKRAFTRFKNKSEFEDFIDENNSWLDDYALFMALKQYFKKPQWTLWDVDIRYRKKDSIMQYRSQLSYQILFWKFVQFIFFKQFNMLKEYAKENNITIIGEIPFYMSMNSVDVWCNPENYMLDQYLNPSFISADSPEIYYKNQHTYTNPVYNFTTMKGSSYQWLSMKIAHAAKIFDVIRIMDFNNYTKFFAISVNETDDNTGKYFENDDELIFKIIKDNTEKIKVIIDFSGHKPQHYHNIQAPNFYNAQFISYAFHSAKENVNMPHNFIPHSVTYLHNFEDISAVDFLKDMDIDSFEFAKKYMSLNSSEGYIWGIIRNTLLSVSEIVIIELTDYLAVLFESHPDKVTKSQSILPNKKICWRLSRKALTDKLSIKIHSLTLQYFR